MRISKQDLRVAAGKGAIGSDQVDPLWRALEEAGAGRPRFDLPHVAYYTGALLVIGAMGWLMGVQWEVWGGGGIFTISVIYTLAFLAVGKRLWDRPGMRTPAGLLVTMAVAMTPLTVYGFQRWIGVWGFDDPGVYKDFHRWIRDGWFAMEVATIAAGVVALRFFRFPFLTAPIAFALWYISMDLTPIIAGGEGFDWQLRHQVSMWFGLVMLFGAYRVDCRSDHDFAFWGYLFGLMAFWGGLSAMDSDSELSKFVYFLINAGLMGLSVFLGRKVFIVFGAMGISGYVGYLAFRVFADSALFPFALTGAGVAVIWLGVQAHRHGPELAASVIRSLPPWALKLRPGRAAEQG